MESVIEGIELEYKDDYLTIYNSGLFDEDWYAKKYLNSSEEINPIIHFLKEGCASNYNPSPNFDVKWYLNENPDVKNSVFNPFVHYIKYGINELRLPKLYTFDEILKLNLNKTLKGRKKFLFLCNDSNNELKQHFDFNYENKFNPNIFKEDYYFKKELFNDLGIDYYYFDVPDKSVICKEYLPFKVEKIKRNVETVKEIIDFKNCFKPNHYFLWDSHMNFEGSNLMVFNIIKQIFNKCISYENYEKLVNNNNFSYGPPLKDLLAPINWSYSKEEENRLIKVNNLNKVKVLQPQLNNIKIPDKFSKFGNRESVFIENKNSLSDLNVLIFRDSSSTNLISYLSLFFRKIFLYWDHFYLNKELINWYNPDMILEIRIERFFENYFSPDWVKDRKF